MKSCSKCGEEKPVEAFVPTKAKKCGSLSYCRACMSEYQAAYRAANAEKRQEWFRANAKRMHEKTASWSRENRGRRNASNARRYATKLRATPAWASTEVITKIYEQAAEASTTTGVPYEVDHIVPLVSPLVCGLHCEANLQLLTAAQNQSKQNRFWPDMFPAAIFTTEGA